MKGLPLYVMMILTTVILLLSSTSYLLIVSSFSFPFEHQQHDGKIVDDVQSSKSSSSSSPSLDPITWDTTLYLREERKRIKRQDEGGLDDESKTLSEGVCDFGSEGALVTCSWYVPEDSHSLVRWKAGTGTSSYWLGGPIVDKTSGENTGGYIYFETSYKASNRVFSSAALESGSDFSSSIQVINDTNGSNGYGSSSSSPPTNFGFNPTSPTSLYKQSLSISNLDEPVLIVPNMAHIYSPNISQTGPQGLCLNFYYNLDGLSSDTLRILVRDMESGSNQTLWQSSVEPEGNWIRAAVAYAYETTHQLILEGVAKSADEPERAYRGYVAVDDLSFAPMGETSVEACHGHCTFEGGMCGWINQEEGDDFDWTLSRGSDNFFTGPARDYYSFSREYPMGGYVYIDAGFPRRPGDRAYLSSPSFEPTGENEAICFKFAVHMYGNGIGTLRVWVRPTDGVTEENPAKMLWEMSGDAGNNWYMAQLPIASASPFQIAFEGVIGNNYLGNIAIDSISIQQGSCPISPQTASRKTGDCTFEENMCFWSNPLVDAHLDDFDWIRQFSYGNFGPKRDHTKKTELGYFMSLNGDNLQPKRGGTYAWLISGEFAPVPGNIPKCMSFYYYMYQRVIDPGGPSLGGLRIYIRTTDSNNNVILVPIWRLNNHQSMKWRRARVALVPEGGGGGGGEGSSDTSVGRKSPGNPYQVVIEGIWGDARVGSIAIDDINFVDGDCSATPVNAISVEGECSFDRNLCGWKNLTKNPIRREGQLAASLNNKVTPSSSSSPSSFPLHPKPRQSDHPLSHRLNSGESITWRLASPNSRPANLQDHTFRAPIGYIFFDVFNQNVLQNPVFKSIKFPAKEGEVNTKCLSFWFSPFGRSDITSLSIYQTVQGDVGDADIGESAPPPSAGGGGSDGSSGNRVLLWSIQTRKFDTRRAQWYYGQTKVEASTPHEISFEGEAIDGGFAIDDITFYDGSCQTRPREAVVATETKES